MERHNYYAGKQRFISILTCLAESDTIITFKLVNLYFMISGFVASNTPFTWACHWQKPFSSVWRDTMPDGEGQRCLPFYSHPLHLCTKI